MLDDYLVEALSRSLVRLSIDGAGLDELLEPRQPTSGENAGKPPSRRGSKPPLSVSMLDLKCATEETLGRWCGALVRACPEVGQAPGAEAAGRIIEARADWLRAHLVELEQQAWATRCAEEVIAQARLVSDVVAPPAAVGDPEPIAYGTAREVAAWCRHLGKPVSRAAIRRAVATGRIQAQTMPDGRVIVQLADALTLASPAQTFCVAHPTC